MAIYDLSPMISAQTAVFPGDCIFSFEKVLSFEKGHHLELSRLMTTPHIGAHADSSSHYHASGDGVEKRPLKSFLGKAQVITVPSKKGFRVLPEDIDLTSITEKRVLFRTGSFPNPNQWTHDFMSLSPELIEVLGKKGVLLVGIDTPSVDPADSKKLESHQALYKSKMSVLEGLVFPDIADGVYFLVALPLPLVGVDASPVRAILADRLEDFI
jgi:arylformamidase